MSETTLIRGGWILTAAEGGAVRDGAVAVEGDTIRAVGPLDELRESHPGAAVRGEPSDVVIPGLVNTHGHFSEGLITGIGSQYTLWEWINELIAKVNPTMTFERAYAGTMLSAIQQLRSGVTTTNDMFCSDPRPDAPLSPGMVKALDEVGLRGVLSFAAGDLDVPYGMDEVVTEWDALREACAGSRLSTFRVGVSTVGRHSDAALAIARDYAVSGGFGVHIHLQEIREEVTATMMRAGRTSVAHCAAEGLFAAPTLAAHCVWVDRADRELLAAHAVGVAHNPVANMILASGIAPVAEMRALGIRVGLGVDGAASNDSQDMLQAVKSAPLLARTRDLQATAMSAQEAFEMATIGGARALRMADTIGSLEPGKKADIVVLDGSTTLANVHDPYQAVVFVAGARDVREVWVDGALSVADFEVCRVDPREVAAASRPIARAVVTEAGLGHLSALVG